MATDMTRDIFAEQPYGKAALKKIGKVSENFRLYYCSWGDSDTRSIMMVTGAEFRKAKRGKLKNVLSILVKGTEKTVYVTTEEIERM